MKRLMPTGLITQLADETFDAVFVTLKCHQLEGRLPDLKQLADNGAQLFFMQNGLGSLDLVRHQLPSDKLKQGITPFNISEPGQCAFPPRH